MEPMSGASRNSRIVTLGEAMLRLTAPAGERLEAASQLRTYVAGSEANVARMLARLGAPVSWVSALPDSPLGERIVRELMGDGVGTSFVQRPGSGRVGLFFVEQGSSPRPTTVWYDRAGSAFRAMSTFDESALTGASFALISGITPALGARSRRLAERFAARARAAGALLCVDVNYRKLLWSPGQARRALTALLAEADVVVCSERDARTVFGATGEAPELAPAFAERWAPRASRVVLTCGERGSILVAGDSVIAQAAHPVAVLDRFGAGDAFMAGLLWALWSGSSDRAALRSATMLAALKCTILGDVALFSATELAVALESSADGVIVR
jgi:2-dehydro-3-deoxygluconokinase